MVASRVALVVLGVFAGCANATSEDAAAAMVTLLEADAVCAEFRPGQIDVSLRWQREGPPPAGQRIQISFFEDFRDPAFVQQFEVARDATSHRIEGRLAGGTTYYWRLGVGSGEAWDYSTPGRFQTPMCPGFDTPDP